MRLWPACSFTLLALAICAHPSFCQERSSCKVSVAAAVALDDGQILRGLKARNFSAKAHGRLVKITAARLDTRPKRILFLFDLGDEVSGSAWKIATGVAAFVATNARPEDTFALLTFDGPREAAGFPQPREDIVRTLIDLSSARPTPGSRKEALYDGLLEAAHSFNKPQFGDAVFLFSHWRDEGSHTSLQDVEEAYSSRELRLFVFTFGQGPSGMYFSTIERRPDGKLMSNSSPIVAIRADLDNLAERTGGALVGEDTESEAHTYQLTDTRLGELEKLGWRIYGQIAEPYSLDLDLSKAKNSGSLEIKITDDILKKFPAHVLYSRVPPPCTVSPHEP